MSLDIYLKVPDQDGPPRQAIFIREHGATKEITREEWDQRYPGDDPILLEVGGDDTVYQANITHNLGKMALEAGIYEVLWRPEEVEIEYAKDLIGPLTSGLILMTSHPKMFRKYDSPNGWGTYEDFVPFVAKLLDACREYPDAKVEVSR